MQRIMFRTAFIVLLGVAAMNCQRIGEPTPTPTTDQWRRVQENLLEAPPTLDRAVNATFGDSVRLLGWELADESVEVGDELEVTFYWEVLRPLPERWHIFVHLDGTARQNLDHEAIDNLYPTIYWEPGQIIRDRVTATLSNEITSGDVRVLVGFFQGEVRLPVTEPGSATVDPDGRLDIGAFEAVWEAPSYRILRADEPITVDGRATERDWTRAPRTSAWVHPVSGDRVSGLDTWAKMLWDDSNLYVLMNARDTDVWSTITERDGNLWEEEVLEFYFDGASNGRNYLEFQVNPLNTVFDAVFARATNRDLPRARAVDIEDLETAVFVSGTTEERGDRDRSWTAEIRIPLDSLPSFSAERAAAGATVRVNFYRYDRTADGEVRTSAWSVVGPGSFHNPPRFGTATFFVPDEAPEGSGRAERSSPRR
jgi:hypothetical protein